MLPDYFDPATAFDLDDNPTYLALMKGIEEGGEKVDLMAYVDFLRETLDDYVAGQQAPACLIVLLRGFEWILDQNKWPLNVSPSDRAGVHVWSSLRKNVVEGRTPRWGVNKGLWKKLKGDVIYEPGKRHGQMATWAWRVSNRPTKAYATRLVALLDLAQAYGS